MPARCWRGPEGFGQLVDIPHQPAEELSGLWHPALGNESVEQCLRDADISSGLHAIDADRGPDSAAVRMHASASSPSFVHEEGDLQCRAPAQDRLGPGRLHVSGTVPALAAADHPVG